MNTITLPDTISFEEIALKWCDILDFPDAMGISFVGKGTKINSFTFFSSKLSGDVFGYSAADYYPSDRKIIILNEEKFQPILDFIKERSNG